MLRRYLPLFCLVWMLHSAPAIAQTTDVFAPVDGALNAGELAQAQQQVLEILRSTREPAVVGGAALRLAQIAQLSGNLPAAEAPLRGALKRVPATDPAAKPALATIYLQLGSIALARGETSRAQLALMKGLAIGNQVAPNDPMLLEAELTLATAEIRAFRLSDATTRLAGLRSQIERGPQRLAALYQVAQGELAFRQYDYMKAMTALRTARDIFVTQYGPEHAEVARVETALGSSLFNAGQYADATAMLQHAAAIYNRVPSFYSPALAVTLVNLGQVYYTTGRGAFAIAAFDKAIALARQGFGPGGQVEATALLHRGYANLRQNDLSSASADLQAAIGIWSAPATANRRGVAGAGVWLAEAERRAGAFTEAKETLNRSAAILADIFGPESYPMTDVFRGQAELALADKQPEQAVGLLQHALAIRTTSVGTNHIASLDLRSLLAVAITETGDVVAARRIIGEVTEVIRQRIALQATIGGISIDEVEALRRLLGRHIAILEITQRSMEANARPALIEESLAIAQLARASAAGQAIADLGRRQAMRTPGASEMLRDAQGAALRWQMAERAVSAQVVAADPGVDLVGAQQQVERLRLRAIDASSAIAAAYPGQLGTSAGSPASLADIRQVLRPKEVLLSYLTLEDQSFLWIVTGERSDFVPISHDAAWFGSKIRALRATVNPKEVSNLSDLLPFATEAAADLYDNLISPAKLAPEQTSLIIVPDGTLQSLPFATLLSHHVAPPEDFAGYRQLPWLVRDRDISILPEIGALTALRKAIRPSQASEPFLGIGDPLLAGTKVPTAPDAAISDLLRSLQPLPEAADELDALATALRASPKAILTSTAATEAAVKAMPLQNYRVIAFATHGLVAGDFGRLREPGLVLTPPQSATDTDDGLLTAGEIADLELDVDWVILSACNTAAADGTPGAEGLSGLARGFFFAGSRALLMSQWEVLSVAAVQLTTGTLTHLGEAPQAGRADSLRKAMLDLMAPEQDDFLAHPIFWAPFELVGEGGAVP